MLYAISVDCNALQNTHRDLFLCSSKSIRIRVPDEQYPVKISSVLYSFVNVEKCVYFFLLHSGIINSYLHFNRELFQKGNQNNTEKNMIFATRSVTSMVLLMTVCILLTVTQFTEAGYRKPPFNGSIFGKRSGNSIGSNYHEFFFAELCMISFVVSIMFLSGIDLTQKKW